MRVLFKKKKVKNYLSASEALLDHSQEMRAKPTNLEKILHSALKSAFRGSQLTIKCQHIIGYRIADFYVPEINTVFEADGPRHATILGKLRDAARDRELAQSGISRVVHLTESELKGKRTKLIEKIRQSIL